MRVFDHTKENTAEAIGMSEDRWNELVAIAMDIASSTSTKSETIERIANAVQDPVELVVLALMVGRA